MNFPIRIFPIHNAKTDLGVTEPGLSDAVPKRIGYGVVLLTFVFFGGWASFAPLDSAALAPGVVTVENYRQSIQHFEGGRIQAIAVRDGDWITEGDLLLTLDSTQFRTELDITRGQLISKLGTEARLKAERDKLDEIPYPDSFVSADARIRETIENENQLFIARRNAHEGEINVLRQRITLLNEQINGLLAINRSKQTLLASYQSELDGLRRLLAKGYVDNHRLKITERNIAEVEGDLAENNSLVAGIRVQQGETQLQVLQIEKEYHTQIVNLIAETQTQLYDLRTRIDVLQDRVNRTEIYSPISGRVISMKMNTLGGVIQPGAPIMDIVPSNANLIVEAQISPPDIDRVYTDTLADIRFSSFRASTTPVIEGKVIHISADRLINEATGMPYFLGRLELTEEGYNKLKELDLTLVPGMPAEVFINTGRRTFIQYLMQPITNVVARSFIED